MMCSLYIWAECRIAANSLLAIKKMVYEDKMLTLSELIALLRSDWEGQEALRLYALNKLPHFGNDNAQSNQMCIRLLKDYIQLANAYDNRADGIKCPPESPLSAGRANGETRGALRPTVINGERYFRPISALRPERIKTGLLLLYRRTAPCP